MNILCHVLVNVDTTLTYLCLNIAERLKEENLNATENLVNGKLQTEHFLFCYTGLLFDFFSSFEVLHSGIN